MELLLGVELSRRDFLWNGWWGVGAGKNGSIEFGREPVPMKRVERQEVRRKMARKDRGRRDIRGKE